MFLTKFRLFKVHGSTTMFSLPFLLWETKFGTFSELQIEGGGGGGGGIDDNSKIIFLISQ